MVYMVTYDLNKQGQNYEKVIQAIKDSSTGVWCSFWKSSYLIKSNYPTANDIFKNIKPYIDNNDKIIVIEVKNNMQGWLGEKEWAYIHDNIFG